MAVKNTLAASVQCKKGRLYAVIQIKENGKSKSVWRTLNLPEGSNKTKIQKAYREAVSNFEEEYAAMLARKDRSNADISIFQYMCTYLKRAEQELQLNTRRSYRNMIYGKIQLYFNKHPQITIENITPKDINKFYEYLFSDGVKANTVIHYHAILHRAFKQAFKDELIDSNPFDRIERPKKNKFQGENYTEAELVELLKKSRTDPLYPAIMLAGGLGLRRSEALGIRWSRIDWEQRTVLLDTKIVESDEVGASPIPIEEMKNKSSRRTLPLPDPVYEMLLNEKEKQAVYKKMFKNSYSREFEDYVCVNQLGELMKPSYVTQHFSDLLKRLGMRHIRFHDLRHTFASILIGNEVPLINVSNFLGHSDISTTANIYSHLDKAGKQVGADVITDIFKKK